MFQIMLGVNASDIVGKGMCEVSLAHVKSPLDPIMSEECQILNGRWYQVNAYSSESNHDSACYNTGRYMGSLKK